MTTTKTKKSVQLSVGGIILIAIIALCVSMFAVERIDSGQTGIIVNLAGSERGVDDAKVETGWVFYNRFTKQLFKGSLSIAEEDNFGILTFDVIFNRWVGIEDRTLLVLNVEWLIVNDLCKCRIFE